MVPDLAVYSGQGLFPNWVHAGSELNGRLHDGSIASYRRAVSEIVAMSRLDRAGRRAFRVNENLLAVPEDGHPPPWRDAMGTGLILALIVPVLPPAAEAHEVDAARRIGSSSIGSAGAARPGVDAAAPDRLPPARAVGETHPAPPHATRWFRVRRAPWALLVVLFAGVTLVVYGLARWQPFEPEAPAAAQAPPGDAVRGEAVFARACAACHGAAAEGGVGPALAGSGVEAGQVIAVVAAGRGAMPAGVVEGQEAADVAAYVARISGADAGSGTTPEAPEAGGDRVTFTGEHATGVSVRLDEDAPADWTVWVEGPAGRLAVARIPAGGRVAGTGPVDGDPLIGRYDTVLVGADADAPALSGALAPERADDLLFLLDHDPASPGGRSALQSADGQIVILREHVRFLVAARDEDNLANVRFHGEHMVNVSHGRPVRDVDGNGDPSNPGDGLGLIDGRDAHLPRISTLAGPTVAPAVRDLSALLALIADAGERCGTAATVDDARPAIAAIDRADARLGAAWSRLRTRAERSAVIELERR